ncbi:MAG: hypothetical protein MUF87_06855 [Anaerolineae bacterium]|jgi:hypothetical protein|nr:hypothetical protein [Anaerolineae bacterium]
MRLLIVTVIGLALITTACNPSSASTPTQEVRVVTATDAPTLVPTSTLTPPITPTLTPDLTLTSPTPDLAATDELNVLEVVEMNFGAPLRINFPDGWTQVDAALPLNEAGTTVFLPFTVFRGEVTGGTGFITVLWGFQNVTNVDPGLEAGAQIDLRADGIRLLTFTIMDPGCIPGFDVTREFNIGEIVGVGAFFAVTGCPADIPDTPKLPDIKGWFVLTQYEGVNFAFYVYTEPDVAMDGPALGELQAIMDTVEIDFALMPTAAPFPTLTPTP